MKRQVVVVGAGPGGSSAAFHLAKKGLDVLLIDKENWPREKVCGDAYQSTLYPIFKDMGIYEEMEAEILSTVRIIQMVGPGEEVADFRTEHAEWLIPRRIGDDIIRCGAIRSGVDFMEGFDATDLIMKKGQVKGIRGIYNNQEMTVEADLVIIANGSHSMLARQIGIFNNDPSSYLFAIRGYWDGVENMVDGTSCWIYDPDFIPGDKEMLEKYAFQPMWIGPLNEGATKASVGCCVSEGLLRAHNMSIDQYFNYWLEHSQIAKKYLSNAHCVDGMKGWRLPNAPQILKNYGPGCMVIGDAASCPDPCYYYGVSPAMYGGKICAEVAEKAFKENDFSEELLSEFHVKLGEMFNPAWKQYVTIRETIIGNREVYRDLLRFAKEKPEYPNIDFGATFGEYMKLVLKKNEGKFEFGNHLAGHEQ